MKITKPVFQHFTANETVLAMPANETACKWNVTIYLSVMDTI
jgi:hypothetical protein